MKMIHIIGGGTFSHIRNHLALAAPASGGTAKALARNIQAVMAGPEYINPYGPDEFGAILHLTKMADSSSKLVTNDDVSALLDTLIADPSTRCIILSAALCDYDGAVLRRGHQPDPTPSGSHAPRLKTANGERTLRLTPAPKLIGKIRKERKDIFVVGFKTTTDASSDEQYATALKMLKRDSLNLVLANDTITRNNMIVAPEETRYFETTDREAVLLGLTQMVMSRIHNTFTRSTVVEGESEPWDSPLIPDNLREVVNHCIARGAYKPVLGVTAGHFAVKVDEGTILTSKRKQDFNRLPEIGLVRVEYEDDTKVIAHGAKPSVGGQSQRIVFREHSELDCIVHFHCPPKVGHPDFLSGAEQWQNECGSHQCGANTSRNLRAVRGRDDIKMVFLQGHGPNIVFSRKTPAQDVIEIIEANFDLDAKTGGLVAA